MGLFSLVMLTMSLLVVAPDARSQDVASFAGSSWPPSALKTTPGEVAESSFFDTSGGALKLVQLGKASTVVGLQKAYAEVPANSPLGFIAAGSVFSDVLTLAGLDLTPEDLNPTPGSSATPRPIPQLNIRVTGRIISSRPEIVASGPFFEIRYLALLAPVEISLATFAEYLVGIGPKPTGSHVVTDRTWDEESVSHHFGVNGFAEAFTGNLAYVPDGTNSVRYGGWAYSGFYVAASEYYKLDFFNSVQVTAELPGGASLESASGYTYAAAVPEPSFALLMIAGLCVVAVRAIRR